MDPEKGRKAIGGKIEIKIRLREPLTDKDVEILTQKWLVIEAFVMPSNRVSGCNNALSFHYLHCQNGTACCKLSTLSLCYNLLKQRAASLWITSFDNQLATSLLNLRTDLSSTSCRKPCERILISACL